MSYTILKSFYVKFYNGRGKKVKVEQCYLGNQVIAYRVDDEMLGQEDYFGRNPIVNTKLCKMTQQEFNDLSLEEFTEKVRDAVLDALDSVSPDNKGWIDRDLKALFPSIDRHAQVLYKRKTENV